MLLVIVVVSVLLVIFVIVLVVTVVTTMVFMVGVVLSGRRGRLVFAVAATYEQKYKGSGGKGEKSE